MADTDTTYCFTLNNERKLTKLTKDNDTLIDNGAYDLGDATNIANAATGSTPASNTLSTDNQQQVAPGLGQNNSSTVVNMENKTPFGEIIDEKKEDENEVKDSSENKKRAPLFNFQQKNLSSTGTKPSMTRKELKDKVDANQTGKLDSKNGGSKLGGKHTRKHKVRRNHNKSHKMKSNKTRGKKTGKKSKASHKYRK